MFDVVAITINNLNVTSLLVAALDVVEEYKVVGAFYADKPGKVKNMNPTLILFFILITCIINH